MAKNLPTSRQLLTDAVRQIVALAESNPFDAGIGEGCRLAAGLFYHDLVDADPTLKEKVHEVLAHHCFADDLHVHGTPP